MDRMVYSMPGDRTRLEFAKRVAPRNFLVSIYYLKEKDPDILRDWYELTKPGYLLFVDSGVHSFKAKLKMTNITQAQLGEGGYKNIELPKGFKDDVDKLAKAYIKFLSSNKEYFDFAFEMDVDEFMGVGIADEYYRMLCDGVGSEKIVRVWHTTRTMEDWIDWCKDPKQPYLAIEGGAKHNQDPQFYTEFIHHATFHNKRVHGLALTGHKFLKRLNITTVDSSSFRIGSRYGKVYIPNIGIVNFGSSELDHYNNLTDEQKIHAGEWLESIGFSVAEMLEDPNGEIRNIANIKYFERFIDTPYIPQSKQLNMFTGEFI